MDINLNKNCKKLEKMAEISMKIFNFYVSNQESLSCKCTYKFSINISIIPIECEERKVSLSPKKVTMSISLPVLLCSELCLCLICRYTLIFLLFLLSLFALSWNVEFLKMRKVNIMELNWGQVQVKKEIFFLNVN